jgi:hypothetical protein
MSTTASVIAHVATDPTELHATQVRHDTGRVSINLSLYVAGSFLVVAGPAPVLRALLTAQLAVLDQADPERGNRGHLEQPFTPPRPAAVAPTQAEVTS